MVRATAKAKKHRGLTAKQHAFALAYVVHGVGATAYREVYDAAGMKPGAIYNEVSRLLDNPQITRRISELQERAAARAEISLGRILRELGKIAFLDVRKIFDETGQLKPVAELDDATAAAVSGIEYEEIFTMQGEGADRKRVHTGRIHKIKLADKKTALDSLSKHVTPSSSVIPPDESSEVGGTWEEFLKVYRKTAPTEL